MQSDNDNHLFNYQRQIKKNNSFGPQLSSNQIEAKQLEDDFKKKQCVSFKREDEIIIVENWKQYNQDVSNLSFRKKQIDQSKSECFNICTTF